MLTTLKLSLAGISLVGGTALVTAELVGSQEPGQEPAGIEIEGMDMAAMMKAMELRPEHQELAKRQGKWNWDMTHFMGPDQPPMEMTSTSEVKTVLGDRYIVEKYQGNIMGMPFEGIAITGFDNLTEEYVSIWMDNMSTTPQMSRGKKQANGAVEMHGSMRDYMTPEGRPFRSVVQGDGEQELLHEMYDNVPGVGEFKVMTLKGKKAQ